MNDDLLDQVKAAVGDPRQAPAVHDLLHRAVADVVAAVNGDDFPIGMEFSDEELARRTDAFEALAAPIVRAAAWGTRYGDPAMRLLWPSLVGRAANTVIRTGGRHDVWHYLNRYPAVLILYGAGIGALAGARSDVVAALFRERAVLERTVLEPIAAQLGATSPFLNDIAHRLPGPPRAHRVTPASDRVYGALNPLVVDDLIPGEAEFASLFDRFEYLLTLVQFDMHRGDGDRGWAAGGRFMWRTEEGHRVEEDVRAEIAEMGKDWPLLREGLFRRSVDRLSEAVEGFDKIAKRY